MTILVIVILALAIIWIGHNFLGQISLGKLNLVAAGTQQAVNPTGQAALNAVVQGQAIGQSANAQYNAQALQAQAQIVQSQQNQNNILAAGIGLGSIIGGFVGGDGSDN